MLNAWIDSQMLVKMRIYLQIEGAFTQGIGFYLTENVESTNGKLVSSGTWTYKIPTADLIPKRFHVELYNSPAQRDRFLSSKGAFLVISSSICPSRTAHSGLCLLCRKESGHLGTPENSCIIILYSNLYPFLWADRQ